MSINIFVDLIIERLKLFLNPRKLLNGDLQNDFLKFHFLYELLFGTDQSPEIRDYDSA